MRNRFLSVAAVLGMLWTAQASALTADGQQVPYVGLFGVFELSDANRASDDGYGAQGTIGYPITERSSLEFSFIALQRKRHSDGRDDYKNAIALDYLYDFGFYKFGSELLPEFKPYLLAGLTGIQEDALAHKTYHPGLNAGAGLLVPLRIGSWDWGWAIRTEGKVFAQYNDKDTAPADRQALVDYHFQIGLQIPLSIVTHHRGSDAPATDCALSVVNPVTGRKDCVTDSDHDGVPDGVDKCPGTAPGVAVNEEGCAADKGGDADGDGVLDSDDQCPGTAPGIKVDAKGCAIDQTLILQGVNFETGSAVLTGDAAATLDLIAQSLNGQPNSKIEIGGHTDNVGSEAYNLTLSQQRAEAVRQYLIGKGVDAARMTTQGYGTSKPIESNATEKGRAINRRVEFKIVLQ